MNESEDVQRLIRLKRYESPGDEYFQTFLSEFKDRQRSELLQRSARSLFFERLSMWIDETGGARVYLPAGAAVAAVLGVGLYFATASADHPAVETYAAAPGSADNKEAFAAGPSASEDEIIRLQLPKPSSRVPGLGADSLTSNPGVLPAGAKGSFREL